MSLSFQDGIRSFLVSHRDPGLYLFFPDGGFLDLSHRVVAAEADRLEHDPAALPDDRRAAAEFRPCPVCPARETAAMCHALPAILPFLDALDRYGSFDPVTAVYLELDETQGALLHVSATTLQRALQFVAMQSVLNYCEVGRLYRPYFSGVIPFTSAAMMAERIYANVMLEKNGDHAAIESVIAEMRAKLAVTMNCQIKRVRLVAQNDGFLNAFVNLHLTLEMLGPEHRDQVRADLSRRGV